MIYCAQVKDSISISQIVILYGLQMPLNFLKRIEWKQTSKCKPELAKIQLTSNVNFTNLGNLD